MSFMEHFLTISCLAIFLFPLCSAGNATEFIHELSTQPFQKISYNPPELIEFRSDDFRVLSVTFESVRNAAGNVSFECANVWGCAVLIPNGSIPIHLTKKGDVYSQSIEVVIHARLLGLNQLNVKFNDILIDDTYSLRLLRSSKDHFLTKLFTVFAAIFVICVTFMMGTQLEITRVKEIIRRPIGPLTGFLCQFFIMPLWSFTLAVAFLPADQPALRFALFATGCSPGGGKSSFWTIIFDGNLDLSVSMTFTQTIAALGMMPLWIYTLGAYFFTERVQVPFLNIFESLLALIVPSICGMIFIRYKKHLIEKFAKWIKIVTWIAAAMFTIVGFIIYLFTWPIIICGCALPWSGYIIAYFIAWLFRQKHRERITIAIETGIQNIGIPILMLMVSLPEPESDLSIIMPIAIVLLTDKPLIIIWLIQKCYRKYYTCEEEETPKSQHGSVDTELSSSQHGINLKLNGKNSAPIMEYTRRDSLPYYDNHASIVS